jgi:hypothetical protein
MTIARNTRSDRPRQTGDPTTPRRAHGLTRGRRLLRARSCQIRRAPRHRCQHARTIVAAAAVRAAVIARITGGTLLEASRDMRARWSARLASALVLGAAVPALAQSHWIGPTPGPSTAPTTPTAPAPAAPTAPAGGTGTADSDGPERNGPFFTASVGVPAMDLQLGWMLEPWLGVFVSDGKYTGGTITLSNGRQAVTDVGVQSFGIRLGSGLGFAEVQIASLTTTNACEDDDPCIHRESGAAILGAGLELIHTQHFGLHLRTQVVIERHDVVPLLHLGLGFYF